jgi:hypothetical protein
MSSTLQSENPISSRVRPWIILLLILTVFILIGFFLFSDFFIWSWLLRKFRLLGIPTLWAKFLAAISLIPFSAALSLWLSVKPRKRIAGRYLLITYSAIYLFAMAFSEGGANVNPETGEVRKFYNLRPTGEFYFSDEQESDPDFVHMKLKPVTNDVIVADKWVKGYKTNPNTGKPLQFCGSSDGRVIVFESPFHDVTSEILSLCSKEELLLYAKQQDTDRKKSEMERRIKELTSVVKEKERQRHYKELFEILAEAQLSLKDPRVKALKSSVVDSFNDWREQILIAARRALNDQSENDLRPHKDAIASLLREAPKDPEALKLSIAIEAKLRKAEQSQNLQTQKPEASNQQSARTLTEDEEIAQKWHEKSWLDEYAAQSSTEQSQKTNRLDHEWCATIIRNLTQLVELSGADSKTGRERRMQLEQTLQDCGYMEDVQEISKDNDQRRASEEYQKSAIEEQRKLDAVERYQERLAEHRKKQDEWKKYQEDLHKVRGKVALVRDNVVYLDKGYKHGLQVGVKVKVTRIGEIVLDSEGQVLDIEKDDVGELSVVKVLENSAVCDVLVGRIKVGDDFAEN